MTKLFCIIGLLLNLPVISQAQTLTGPTCVTPGVTYTYTLVAATPRQTRTFCVTNGFITPGTSVTCRTSALYTSVSVKFTAGQTSGVVSCSGDGGYKTIQVTIVQSLSPGNIAVNNVSQSINYNSTPSTLSCSNPTGGGCSPNYTFSWQRSIDQTSWTNINGATSATYSPPSLTETTYYRRFVSESISSESGYSNVATVFVYPALNPGSITPINQPTVARYGTANTLYLNGTSGGNGTYSRQWQVSIDGGNFFNNIPGATGSSFIPTNITESRKYRVLVSSNEVPLFTNTANINVWPPVSATGISPLAQTVIVGNNPLAISITGVSGGNGAYTYRWYRATTLGAEPNWQIIDGATSATFSPGPLFITNWYRVEVASAGSVLISASAAVHVVPSLSAGTIQASTTSVSYNSSPGLISGTNPSGGICPAYTFVWKKSEDGISYSIIESANAASYLPGNLTQKTYYQRTAICGTDSAQSNLIEIYVNPELKAGEIGSDRIFVQPNAIPGILIASTAYGGSCAQFNYQWQQSNDNITFGNISGANALNYNPNSVGQKTFFRRMVVCGTDTAYTASCVIEVGSTIARHNFIRVRDIKVPLVNDLSVANSLNDIKDVNETTQYFDGLGSLIQTVSTKASTSGKDVVVAQEYDEFGRLTRSYLPYPANGADGSYKTNYQSEASFYYYQQYGGETHPFSSSAYEASPISRSNMSFSPGGSWVGSDRGIVQKNFYNTTADAVRIWKVQNDNVGSFANFHSPTTYVPGKLYKGISIDEHGMQTIEFKDFDGKVILKKVQVTPQVNDGGSGSGHTGWLNTYYLYDGLNRLRCVIQPEGVRILTLNSWDLNIASGKLLAEQCFQYAFDDYSRMVVKKVPGAGAVNMVYDARDRLVLTQDANLEDKGKWLYNTYDNLGRLATTGLLTDSHDRVHHAGLAKSSINYPNVGNFAAELLTHTLYDNYSQLTANQFPFSAVRSIVNDGSLTSPSSSWPYPEGVTSVEDIKSFPTAIRTTVPGTSQILYKTLYYDEEGRVTQIQSTNITGGTDVFTTQYTWGGQALTVIERSEKQGANSQIHTVLTKYEYDKFGRLYKLWKDLDNSGSDHLLSISQYDELGQLKQKDIGSSIETLRYEYNIRGWLLGINRDYLKDVSLAKFGFELGYDKSPAIIAGTAYTHAQYNGNIAGVIWKSLGDGEKRKYDFTYDGANRLLKGDFTQFTNSGFNQDDGINFDMMMGDGVDPWTAYDANGNIARMQQWGLKGVASQQIDDLHYAYYDHSNRLKNVRDFNNDPNTKLGDFRSSSEYSATFSGAKPITATDYEYDENGNLISDLNKDFTDPNSNAITYNHLNIPIEIKVKDKGSIEYLYDASGTKLKKIVHETGKPDKSTLYLNSGVYSNDTLQFLGHEEGRIRYAKKYYTNGDSAHHYFYDYFLKDHLGNVRMVLTEQKDTAHYIATMEAAYRAKENALFSNISQSSAPVPTAPDTYPSDLSITNPNDSLAKLNGNGQKVGPSIVLKVMSGDKIDIAVKSFYHSNGTSGQNSPFNDILAALADGILGVAGDAKGTLTELTNLSTSPLLGGVNQFRNVHNPNQPTKPKAYLNWILLDEQFKYVESSSGAQPVGNAEELKTLGVIDLAINKNGFLYIYVSNETPFWDVFFDNLSVKHHSGPIVEETHYYPFGLTMAGISSHAIGKLENKSKFNDGAELQNSEFTDGSGLQLYDAKFRQFDAQTGRFHQLDPLADFYDDLSLYSYAYNNPNVFNDPFGLAPKGSKENGFGNYAGWIDPADGSGVYFDPNVHGQSDLPRGTGTYLGEEILISDDDGNPIGYGNDQGRISYDVNLPAVTVSASKTKKGLGFYTYLTNKHYNGLLSGMTASHIGLKAVKRGSIVHGFYEINKAYKYYHDVNLLRPGVSGSKVIKGIKGIGKLAKRLGPAGNLLTAGSILYELKAGRFDAHSVVDGGLLVTSLTVGGLAVAGVVAAPVVAAVAVISAAYGALDYFFDVGEKLDRLVGKNSDLWRDD